MNLQCQVEGGVFILLFVCLVVYLFCWLFVVRDGSKGCWKAKAKPTPIDPRYSGTRQFNYYSKKLWLLVVKFVLFVYLSGRRGQISREGEKHPDYCAVVQNTRTRQSIDRHADCRGCSVDRRPFLSWQGNQTLSDDSHQQRRTIRIDGGQHGISERSTVSTNRLATATTTFS